MQHATILLDDGMHEGLQFESCSFQYSVQLKRKLKTKQRIFISKTMFALQLLFSHSKILLLPETRELCIRFVT